MEESVEPLLQIGEPEPTNDNCTLSPMQNCGFLLVVMVGADGVGFTVTATVFDTEEVQPFATT